MVGAMPKNGRCRSTARKPLSNISNVQKKPSCTTKKEEESPPGRDDSVLDRLMLSHTDLSKIINQIDELVVQVFRNKMTCKIRSSEIDSFINCLSSIHSSLKPWLQRFEKAFGTSYAESVEEVGQFLDKNVPVTNEENVVSNDVREIEMDLIVSPSPLVSWRTGTSCTIDTGKQLFLLTPLPKSKAVPPKLSASSKSFAAKILANKDSSSCAAGLLPTAPKSIDAHLSDKDAVNLQPNANIMSAATAAEGKLDLAPQSPLNLSNHRRTDCSVYLLTPCLKSSYRLDSISESFHEEKKVHKLTPWAPRGNCPVSDDSSCDEDLKCLESKYPELHLILEDNKIHASTPLVHHFQVSDKSSGDESLKCSESKYAEIFGLEFPTDKPTARRKDITETLDWFLSPPKTCILLEPPNKLPPASNIEIPDQGLECKRGEIIESTPMWKGMESTACKGKKGENTLKRELWTKFQAVSAPGTRLDTSVFQKSSKKGFLDMLEEVSNDKTCSESRET